MGRMEKQVGPIGLPGELNGSMTEGRRLERERIPVHLVFSNSEFTA